MRHIIPRKNGRLPHRIQQLLNDMFAGSSGLGGRQLIDFFGQHSLKIPIYEAFPTNSRRVIFEHCLSMFSTKQQKHLIREMIGTDIPGWHGSPKAEDIATVRSWLESAPTALSVFSDDKSQVDWPRVRENWQKATARVSDDPSGAITAARSLLESTCLQILGERNVTSVHPRKKLQDLYGTTMEALGKTPAKAPDAGRNILQGCFQIVLGIASLRNSLSDAHGHAPDQNKVRQVDANLAVNAAGTLASFLVGLHLGLKPSHAQSASTDVAQPFSDNIIPWRNTSET